MVCVPQLVSLLILSFSFYFKPDDNGMLIVVISIFIQCTFYLEYSLMLRCYRYRRVIINRHPFDHQANATNQIFNGNMYKNLNTVWNYSIIIHIDTILYYTMHYIGYLYLNSLKIWKLPLRIAFFNNSMP